MLARNGIPLHLQLATLIRNRIVAGDLEEGAPLPTEDEAAQTFGVSRTVVRQAMLPLVMEGLVTRIPGKGTFVGSVRKGQSGWSVGSIEELLAFGRSTRLEVFDRSTVPATPDVAERLGIVPKTPVFRILGLRHAGPNVISYQRNFVLKEIGQRIADADFSDGTVFSTIEQRTGVKITEMVQTISSVAADKELASKLNVKLRAPLLQTERLQLSRERGPVTYSLTHYRADLFQYTVKLVRMSA